MTAFSHYFSCSLFNVWTLNFISPLCCRYMMWLPMLRSILEVRVMTTHKKITNWNFSQVQCQQENGHGEWMICSVIGKWYISSYSNSFFCFLLFPSSFVSSFLVVSIKGMDAICRHPGMDNTEGFSGIQHPAKVWDMIHDYYVGDVVKHQQVVYTFKELSKM